MLERSFKFCCQPLLPEDQCESWHAALALLMVPNCSWLSDLFKEFVKSCCMSSLVVFCVSELCFVYRAMFAQRWWLSVHCGVPRQLVFGAR